MPTSVVTGAASGIGAAVCEQLKQQGHTVIGIDRSSADIIADLSSSGGRQSAVEAVLEKTGGSLDHLILCAGLGVSAPSSGLIVSVNYFGVSELLEGLFQALKAGESPSAVVVGSVASVLSGAEQSPLSEKILEDNETSAVELANEADDPQIAYGSSKYAVSVMARRKAIEWGKAGVRLNVVAPGAVETPLLEASKEHPKYGEATKKFVAPLGRGSRPEELADVIRYLISPQASFIHGSLIFADGGMEAMVRPDRF